MAKELPVKFIAFSAYPDDEAHLEMAREFIKQQKWTQEDVRIVRHRGGVHVVTKKCVLLH